MVYHNSCDLSLLLVDRMADPVVAWSLRAKIRSIIDSEQEYEKACWLQLIYSDQVIAVADSLTGGKSLLSCFVFVFPKGLEYLKLSVDF